MTRPNAHRAPVHLPESAPLFDMPIISALTSVLRERIPTNDGGPAASAAEYEILSATAGFIYTRKDNQTVDLLGGPRALRYAAPDDDLVLSVTIRLTQEAATKEVDSLHRAAAHIKLKALDDEVTRALDAVELANRALDQARAARAAVKS